MILKKGTKVILQFDDYMQRSIEAEMDVEFEDREVFIGVASYLYHYKKHPVYNNKIVDSIQWLK